MKYDFDQIVDRRNTYSIKYTMTAGGKEEDLLPMWIADMDFKSPPCVTEALFKQCQHGIFGYPESGASYFPALQNWFQRRHNWHIEEEWLVKTSGIVNAIHIALLALTEAQDGVLIQQPVYHYFAGAVEKTGRKLVINELVNEDGYYRIDFADFEAKIARDDVKIFILCNPHNPVGRVWTQEELTEMGDICLKYGVPVIADEIHQDFVFAGHKHLVFAALDPRYKDITITCTAPSKTFNLAGLPLANIFIANSALREKFICLTNRFGLGHLGVMGVIACRAAYESGDEWLEQLLDYLAANMSFVAEFLEEKLPAVRFVMPEGTYLAWLDFRSLGLDPDKLDALILGKARLWLNRGDIFGAGSAGFQRLNTACPRSLLDQAMIRLESAF